MYRSIIFLLLFISYNNYAQDYLPLSSFKVLEARELSNGMPIRDDSNYDKSILTTEKNIIYSTRYVKIPPLMSDSTYISETEDATFKLTSRDTNLTILHEWHSQDYHQQNPQIRLITTRLIKEIEDHIIVMGVGTNEQLPEYNYGYHIFKYKFSKSLELLEEDWIEYPIQREDSLISIPTSILINQHNNYLITSEIADRTTGIPIPNSLICELDQENNIIRYTEDIALGNHSYLRGFISEMANGHYIYNGKKILDSSLNIVHNTISLSDRMDLIPYVHPISDDRFVFGGIYPYSYVDPSIGMTTNYVECLFAGNTNGHVDTIMYNLYNREFGDLDLKPSLMALSAVDTNNIYIAMQRGFEIPLYNNYNYGTIFSLNINGSLNWSYTFGAQTDFQFHVPIDILTLPNGNCFLTVHRHSPSGTGYLDTDIIYIIIDQRGEVVNLVTDLSTITELENKIEVYPNPTSDYIRLSIDEKIASKDLNIQIWTINGQLLQTNNLQNNQDIDLRNIDSGTYIYTISNKKELVYSDKLIIQR